ncbi:MAG TPA: carbohydrate ABC transporter permease [Gemmatimonadales bacterium]|nr:carbohydrate ABC transporter permease [Gemmatimonadales bacterium]
MSERTRRRPGRAVARGLGRAGGALLLLALAAAMLTPFGVMVSTSLMDEFEALQYPPRLLPSSPRWANYPEALTALPFGRFYLNSLVFAGAVVAGQVVTASMAGYAFARFRFPGRDRLFGLMLATLMLPAVVVLIPRFLLLHALGWVDTLHGLVSTELVSVWGIFLLRQAFLALPRELEEAARLDGAGEWAIFRHVALPAVRPALATLALFAFIDAWKNYLWPLVATRSLDLRTVEVGVASFHGFYYAHWPYQMAAAVTATLPLLLVFLVAQRHFVRGLQLTGFK